MRTSDIDALWDLFTTGKTNRLIRAIRAASSNEASADLDVSEVGPVSPGSGIDSRKGLDEGLLKTDPKNVYEQRGRQPIAPGYSVGGVESRHATNQVMDSRKVDTCGMSIAGLALPVFDKPAAVVTHGEKMKGPAGGDSCPSFDREDPQEAAACNAISPEQRPASPVIIWNRFLSWLLSGDPRNSRDPLKYDGRDWPRAE